MRGHIVAGPYVLRGVCAYQGESEYTIEGPGFTPGAGSRVHVRYFADHAGRFTPGVFEREILPLVGTVRLDVGQGFPPADVLLLFPGFVGARWVSGAYELSAPARVQFVARDGCTWSIPWREEQRRAGVL